MFRHTLESLRIRNFRLFFIGQSISNVGNWLTNVALILFVLRLTGSGLAVGLLAAAQFGPMLFLSAWAGAVCDRVDKRRALYVTQGLEMAQSVGLAVLAFMPHPSVAALFGLAVFGGVLLAFDNPLRRAFVPEMAGDDALPNAVVLYSIIISGSQVFGPALAGLLTTTVGYGWAFTIDAASYIAVLASLAMMRPAELYRTQVAPRSGHEIREGIAYVLSLPFLWISFAMYAVVGIFSFNLRVALPLLVVGPLHSTDVAFTILYSVVSIGGVVGALVVAARRFVQLRHVIIGSTMLGVALLLLAVTPSVAVAVPAAFLVGAASVVYSTATTAVAQVGTRRTMHGRVLALQTAIMGGTALVGGPAVGHLGDRFGGRAPILVGGVVCLLAAAFGQWAQRRAATITAG
ncbi:MAG TPA: MFS transporter [Gemmatimonadaceae bacterium]|nr:MFS transporter [Gemmatimonadaceae bacterium]